MMSNKFSIPAVAVAVAALLAGPAEAARRTNKRPPTPNTENLQVQRPIYGWAGQYRGTDPDPNIRFQLMRDQNLR
jgi:hypothetical protein